MGGVRVGILGTNAGASGRRGGPGGATHKLDITTK
jgi:hypothetical protein